MLLTKHLINKKDLNLVVDGVKAVLLLEKMSTKDKVSIPLPFFTIDIKDNVFFLTNKRYDLIKVRSVLEHIKLRTKGLVFCFFSHFKIKGLGFRIRKYVENNICFLRIELGYSHYIFYPLPKEVYFIKGKKQFILHSSNFNLLKRMTNQLTILRKINVYKEKGLILTDKVIRKKSGKQQSSK